MGEQAKLRGQRKGVVIRHLNSLLRNISEEDVNAVSSRLEKLSKAFDELEVAHYEYHDTLDDVKAQQESQLWLEDIQAGYIHGFRNARAWLKEQVEEETKSDPPDKQLELLHLIDVPKVELDVFTGDPLHYQTFMAIFMEAVHNKCVDGQARLTRLLQYTGGPAKEAIRNCALIGGVKGYEQAKSILHQRFGNPHLISQSIIRNLTNGHAVSKATEMQQLADEITSAHVALEQLGMLSEVDSQRGILDIIQRCPNWVKARWRKRALKTKCSYSDYPKFNDFTEFMKLIALEMNDPVYGDVAMRQTPKIVSDKGFGYHSKKSSVAQAMVNPQGFTAGGNQLLIPCVMCGYVSHPLYQCDSFRKMSPRMRFEFVVDKKLCFVCFSTKHRAQTCKNTPTCQVPGCNRKHSKLIHIDNASDCRFLGSNNETDVKGTGSASNQVLNTVTSNVCGDMQGGVYVPMVPLMVNRKVSTWALLDSGSTNSFISEKLAGDLNLQGSGVSYHLSTLGNSKDVRSKIVEVYIASSDGQTTLLKNVMVVPNIPATHPKQPIEISKYSHLKGLPLPYPTANAQAHVLVGMDNAHLIMPLEIKCGSKSEPYATRTRLGWSLSGPRNDKQGQSVFSHCISVEQQIDKLWEMEAPDDDDLAMSLEDNAVLEQWEKEIQYENGHYVLPIPWKGGRPNLPHNRYMAMKRHENLIRRLHKSNAMDVYADNIDKLVKDGYAEDVPTEELKLMDGSVWYLPHHPVISEAKPGKVRIVFDCAAKFKGVSLNSECFQGPDLNNKLLHVLLRFRQYEFAVMADVQAMYHQVKIPAKDRNALRFLWQIDDNIKEYRMTSHLFGGVWCASSSTFALRRTLEDFPCSGLVQRTVRKDMYVDDMLKSVPNKEEAVEVMVGTKRILSCGGFNLTKFLTNNEDLLGHVAEEDYAAEVKEIKSDVHSKALGIKWDVSQDDFYYVSKHLDFQGIVTKRCMLSQLSSMYDPLGLILPVVHQGKLLFQQATRLKLPWDAHVPYELARTWCNWLESLRFIPTLRFPRCVCPGEFLSGAAEIHSFADASETGYGACSYIRIINPNGKIHVALLSSKSRLAPLKPISIPRLELCATVLAVQLSAIIHRELDLELMSSTFWSDSQIVIAYIRNENRRFKTFVANRVATVRRNSSPDQWRYVCSDQNPADVLSRGCSAQSVPLSWFSGPKFLTQYKNTWSSDITVATDLLEADIEVKKDVTVAIANTTRLPSHPMQILVEHYSSFYMLKKALCWITRFMSFLRKSVDKSEISGPVTASELARAERQVIQFVQNQSYHAEIIALADHGHVSTLSPLMKLNPVLNSSGLLVIGGRLKHARMPYESRHPVILPSNHKVSRMIAEECHGMAHLGTEWSLSQLRRKYWIVHGRSMLKKVKHACVTCKKLYAPTHHQKMADLPPERAVAGHTCFSYVGVDIFGPFFVKVGRSEVKRYGCLFTCFSTRAIHIEVLSSLESDAFLAGFLRFIARRGCPVKVFSDNGTNLIGAHNELSRSLRQLDRSSIIRSARRHGVEWVFNPPLASHQGGVWERMIRTVRRILCALLDANTKLTDEVLCTVMCDAENLVNSRPITKCSDDPDDDEPLTPNHLLLMHNNASLSWGTFFSGDMYRKRWRYSQHLSDQFWKRWLREYLPQLQKRPKWQLEMENLGVGDLVLVKDADSPRGSWPLGLVLEVKRGRDNLVRSVRLRTKSTQLVRPVTKLVLLEGSLEND